VGFGVVQSIGNAGGAVGPLIMGALRDRLQSYGAALLIVAGLLVVEAVSTWVLIVRFVPQREGGLVVDRVPDQRLLASDESSEEMREPVA
jgi:nitrate/nitrite transporter NarK